MNNIGGPTFNNRFDNGKHRVIRTHHGVKGASLGLYRRSTQRRINEMHALRMGSLTFSGCGGLSRTQCLLPPFCLRRKKERHKPLLEGTSF
jgi:hypothetical protein